MEADVSAALAEHDGKGHELTVEADDPEQVEEGGGRYAKSYFGASVSYRIHCKCRRKGGEDGEPIHEGVLEDKVAASEMDELL